MPTINLEFVIRAPIDRVFDLSRSIELHVDSTEQTGERTVDGVRSGLLGLNDEVTWEAVHFGIRQRLTSRIVSMSRPDHFRDSMVKGPFRRFDHDHEFSTVPEGTRVRDRFNFDAPFGPVGTLANAIFLTSYMETFLRKRLEVVKQVAESEAWTKYLEAI